MHMLIRLYNSYVGLLCHTRVGDNVTFIVVTFYILVWYTFFLLHNFLATEFQKHHIIWNIYYVNWLVWFETTYNDFSFIDF